MILWSNGTKANFRIIDDIFTPNFAPAGQYDKRRKKSFVETFPELEDWYNSIEIDKTIPDVKVTDGRITHYEPGEYISDKDNYNK
jgi:hypothetical protein